jgi:methyl-accepting chemotaxis protein
MLRNVRIRFKAQLSTVFVSVVVVILVATSAVGTGLLDRQVSTAARVNSVTAEGANFERALTDYLRGEATLAAASQVYDRFAAASGGDLPREVSAVWDQARQAEQRFEDNRRIEARVMELTASSIKSSTEYVTTVATRLADPRLAGQVSTIERQVIVGATTNTAANYSIQVLFKSMRLDLSESERLARFLDLGITNASADAERLAGTPFAALPQAALAANREIKTLVERYVANAQALAALRADAQKRMSGYVATMRDVQVGGTRDSFEGLKRLLFGLTAVLVAATAALIVVQVLISRSITRPIARTIDVIRRLESGDFSTEFEVSGRDETAEMLGSLRNMIGRIRELLEGVRESAAHVAASTRELSASAQQLSEGAQSQAATLEQTSASVEELTASVEQVGDHAQTQAASVGESSARMAEMQSSAEQVSRTLGAVSGSSQEAMARARAGMEAVRRAVEAIRAISASSDQIGGIIAVISDIADQTNLLALNASIEAARAGEHGRGFAVVASEVSKLADRSSRSTREIEGLIRESGKSVTAGVEIAQKALQAMEGIIGDVQKTDEMVSALSTDVQRQIGTITEVAGATASIAEMSQSISAATAEQTTSAREVARAIENVNELTQSAASAAEQMSAATEELSGLAHSLQQLVGRFAISDASQTAAPAQGALAAPAQPPARRTIAPPAAPGSRKPAGKPAPLSTAVVLKSPPRRK